MVVLSIENQLSHFDTMSHDDKFREVKNMTRIIGDAGGDLNGLDDTLGEFGKYATDEDLRVIYKNLLLLVKDYQDKKLN